MCSEPVVNSDRTVFKGHANCLGHAEVNAITSNPYMKPYLSCTLQDGGVFYHKNENNVKKARSKIDLVVVRINNNNELKNSRPCSCCVRMMQDIGIRRVYYSTGQDDEIIYEMVSEMVSTHVSYGYKIVNLVSDNNENDKYNQYNQNNKCCHTQVKQKKHKKQQIQQKQKNHQKKVKYNSSALKNQIKYDVNQEYNPYNYLEWWFSYMPIKYTKEKFLFILNMEIMIRYPQGQIQFRKINNKEYYININDPSKRLRFEKTFSIKN